MASKPGIKVPVALPNMSPGSASPSLVGQDTALFGAIGGRVRLTTSNNVPIEGIIYTADPITSLLILEVSAPTTTSTISPSSLTAPSGSYRIIPLSQITSFTILSQGPGTSSNSSQDQSIPQIDSAAATARLEREISNAQSALSRKGPRGTSPRDQALFDALARTHPARWEGSSMVISDSFLIDKPYSSANTTNYTGEAGPNAPNGNAFKGDIARFRNIVDMELRKAEFRVGKAALDAKLGTADGERKGG